MLEAKGTELEADKVEQEIWSLEVDAADLGPLICRTDEAIFPGTLP